MLPTGIRAGEVEQSILFVGVMKWLFFAACMGVMIGLSTTVLLRALEKDIPPASSFRYYFVLLPAAFFARSFIILGLLFEVGEFF